ncbi:two-component response regulator ARR1 [Cucumis sativus]|uniref:two-component response regulator ARR1 n=1 Tax=Cucumis sativus TaxID=3659 RepID=UPI0005EC4DCF|nr:two-component response regulator ARR1 [Cucumis sativus]
MIRRLNIPNNLYPFQYKVLVVDYDYTHLLALDNTFTSLGYQVLTSQNPEHAMAMILNGNTRIDIIVCGIPCSNIGAFNLIRAAKWEFNIPVVLMLSDLNDKVTMREIANGAAQCVLAKLPYTDCQALKNLWQYVASTRSDDYYSSVYVPQIESTSRIEPSFNVVRDTPTTYGREPGSSSNPNTSLDKSHYHVTTEYGGGFNNCSDPNLDLKKREENSEGLDNDHHHHTIVDRKRRFNWTEEYHRIFLDGIDDITLKAIKVVPANITKYMHDRGVSQIQREHVASHLQKYRLNIKKDTHGSGDFANSDVVTNKQTIPKAQNVQQETPPITQPSNEIDNWWDTLEDLAIGLENKSTSSIWPDFNDELFKENNIIPTWRMENFYQPPQLGDQEK